MPAQKHNSFHNDNDNPDYQNLTEAYNKTNTEAKDWDGFKAEVNDWLEKQDFTDFRTEKAQRLGSEFLVKLCRKYENNDPPLFNGLSDEGRLNTATTIASRAAYNNRRRQKSRKSSQTPDAMPTPSTFEQPMQLPTTSFASSPPVNIKAEYNGVAKRITLADIINNPFTPIHEDEIPKKMTLLIFLHLFCEHWNFNAQGVDLHYKFKGDEAETLLANDVDIRAALVDVILEHHRSHSFRIVRKDHDFGDEITPRGFDATPFGTQDDRSGFHIQTPRAKKREASPFEDLGTDEATTETPSKKSRKDTTPLELSPNAKGDNAGPNQSTQSFSTPGITEVRPSILPTYEDTYPNLVTPDTHMTDAPHEDITSATKTNDAQSGNCRSPQKAAENRQEHITTTRPLVLGRTREDPIHSTDDDSMKVDTSVLRPKSLHKTEGTTELGRIQEAKDNSIAPGTRDTTRKEHENGGLMQDMIDLTQKNDEDRSDTQPIPLHPPGQLTSIEAEAEMTKLLARLKLGFEDAKERQVEQAKKRKESLGRAEEEPNEDDIVEDGENGAEKLEERMSHTWPSTITEHLHQDDNRWEDFCQLMRLDPVKSQLTDTLITLPETNLSLHPFQAFGMFVLMEFEVFQNSAYLADEMGLGKTYETLGLIALNRSLAENRKAVREARKKGHYDLHLKKGTTEKPQPKDAKCPSNNPHGIQCTCVDSGMSQKLQPSYGPNIIIVPANLIYTWLTRATQLLPKEHGWETRYAHGDTKYKKIAPKLGRIDRELLKKSESAPYFSEDNDHSNVIVVTTNRCYSGHIKQPLADTETVRGRNARSRTITRTIHWQVGWGRVVIDEAHNEHNPGSGTISLVRQINSTMPNQPPRKIFITGTPFETTPSNMAYWIQTSPDTEWAQPFPPRPDYPRMNVHQRDLQHCTCEIILKIGREHDRLVRRSLDGNPDNQARKEHAKKLAIIVRRLWVRRTGTSNFMGHDLVRIPPNYHLDCLLEYPNKYKSQFEKETQNLYNNVRTMYQKKKKAWQDPKGTATTKPVISATTWLSAARRTRAVSSFPEVPRCENTKRLALTLAEIQERNWMKVKKGCLYELEKMNSPYELSIGNIAKGVQCYKLFALSILMREIWGEDKKVIIMAMGPASALIIYWAIRTIWKKEIALIHSGLSKSTVAEIIKLFQEGKDGPKSTFEDPVPQFIIGSTLLMNTGITLTAAQHVVIFDAEWLLRDEMQAIGRVSRIGQTEETMTIKFVNSMSQIDMAIHDRQNARQEMYKAVEEPTQPSTTQDIHRIAEEDAMNEEQSEEIFNGAVVEETRE